MTKRQMMVEAHRIAREELKGDYQARLSLALRQLWKKKKGEDKMDLVKLKGSDKQVSWAEDIRSDVLEFLDEVDKHKGYAYDMIKDDEMVVKFKKELEEFKTKVKKEEQSKWFIEELRCFHDTKGTYFKAEKMAKMIRGGEFDYLESWAVFLKTYFQSQYRG